MIEALASVADDAPLAFDVLIVGAGAAGIVLALELEGSGLDVAVLEGGDREAAVLSQNRYQGPLTVGEGLAYPPLDAYRLRYLGGTTGHWGGYCRPLEANVFSPRPGRSDVGWPFGRDELDPFYRRAHEWCGLGRYEYDAVAVCADAGVELPLRPTDTLELVTWRYSTDQPADGAWAGAVRFGLRYAERLEAADATVFLGANCVEMEHRRDRITGVLARTEDGTTRRFEAATVVLACGGIENIRQLLLLQRAGVSELDRSGTLGVGFGEHPHLSAGVLRVRPELIGDPPVGPLAQISTDADGVAFRVGFGLTEHVLDEHRLPNMSFTIEALPDEVFVTRSEDEVTSMWGILDGRPSQLVGLYARTEARLDRSSRVYLSDELDDLGLPRAGPDWRVDAQDLTDVVTARRLVAGELAAQGIGPLFVDDDVRLIAPVTGGAHHLGGAPMHDDGDRGVVDPDLRTHALSNLYVTGSAVFPTFCFSNPTLTIVSMAIRLADHLRSAT